jgi:rhodanese-related sulfurtransferase
VLVGALAVVLIAVACSAVWNAVLGRGIPMQGQWDPTKGPVGPRPVEEPGLVTVEQAHQRYVDEVINEFILFVDARTPDNFAEGHVAGALNVPAVFEEVDEYRGLYDEFTELHPPGAGLPIVLYCNGADCEDSHTLRDKLWQSGYFEVLIMFEGYPAWRDAGYPVASSAEAYAADEPLYPASPYRWASFAGMIAALFLAMGAFGAPGMAKLWGCRWVSLAFRLILGGVFLYAALHKIIDPGAFAKQIYGYQLLPGGTINAFAMLLPWVEVVAGVLLVAGAFTRGSALVIALLLVVFIGAVGYNVARGHTFDCGCFQTAEEDHVSDPIELLFRDVALLVLAAQIASVAAHPGVGRLVGLTRKN